MGVLVVVCLAGCGLLAYTWMHVEILRSGYAATELERRLERLMEEERRHRLELSRATRPGHVEVRAREELGMAPPTLDQTLFLEEVAP